MGGASKETPWVVCLFCAATAMRQCSEANTRHCIALGQLRRGLERPTARVTSLLDLDQAFAIGGVIGGEGPWRLGG